MAYATPADLALRYDVRNLLEMPTDTDVAIDQSDLATNDVLLTALSDASGLVNAALLTGNRYSPTALESLTGDAANDLKRIVCTQAYVFLSQRRGGGFPSDLEILERDSKWVEERLDLLRRGVNVFNLPEHTDSGNVSTVKLTPTVVDRAQFMRDRTNNYYPHRVYDRR